MFQSPTNTPFIPPLPSPGGRSIRPPVVPQIEVEEPTWAREPVNMANYPTHYPGMGTPFAGYQSLAPPGGGFVGGGGGAVQHFTPFIPPQAELQPPMMMAHQNTPGSYFAAPRGLPPQTPHHVGGQLSADYTGYPQGPPAHNPYAGTPWAQAAPMPPGAFPHTPYTQPMQPQMMAPHTGYSMFQQLPYGAQPQGVAWGPVAGYGHVPPTPVAGFGMPPMAGGGGGWGGPPQATPWQGQGQQLPPMGGPGRPVAHGGGDRGRTSEGWDLLNTPFDRFNADAQCGPVLEPFLLKRVKAALHINPLLQPAEDDLKRPYLEWNMLFPTARCRRSDDKIGRSWSAGRNDSATFPRVTTLRIVCRGLPWMMEVNAQNPEVGVTCGELIEKICEMLHTLVNKKEMKMAPNERSIHDAYWYNRSTDGYDVPGGRLGDGVRRVDWLLNNTAFGGFVRNDELVRAQCGGAVLPCTFELRCEPRFTKEKEKQEEEARAERAERAERAGRAERTHSHRSGHSGHSGHSEHSEHSEEQSSRHSRSRSRQSIRVNITH